MHSLLCSPILHHHHPIHTVRKNNMLPYVPGTIVRCLIIQDYFLSLSALCCMLLRNRVPFSPFGVSFEFFCCTLPCALTWSPCRPLLPAYGQVSADMGATVLYLLSRGRVNSGGGSGGRNTCRVSPAVSFTAAGRLPQGSCIYSL